MAIVLTEEPGPISLYQRNPNVDFAEPDYYVEPARLPDDPSYRYGQMQLRCCVNAEMAWEVTVGDPSVMIAVSRALL